MKIRHELTPFFCETYRIDRHKDYPVEWIDSRTLLVSERLDLAAKVKYIESRESGQISPFVRDCYVKYIEAFSYGTFKESGNNEKDSIKKYIDSFHHLIDAIKASGFDASKSVIPVGKDNILLDGAHRAAVAIYFNKKIPIIRLPDIKVILAVIFALQGNQVLLVDCDLRRPSVHKEFHLPNNEGLTNLVANHVGKGVDDYLRVSEVEGLSILTGGPVTPNPAEILSSNRMKQLEKELAERFDLVIYDTPPLLGFTDAQVLAGREDGTIFVVHYGVDTKEEVMKASESLKMVNANVLGVVYNRVPGGQKEHSYYYGYKDEE